MRVCSSHAGGSAFRLLEWPAYLWTSIIHAAGYLTAGTCLLVPRTRTSLGPGLLLGVAATAPVGHMYTLYLLATPDENGVAGAGLWFDLIAATLLVIAAVVTVTGLVGSRTVRYRPADPVSWAIIGCGAVGAVTVSNGRDSRSTTPDQTSRHSS